MAKIGTAQIEIKPVLSEEALDAICLRIESAVADGVARGMERGTQITVNLDDKVIDRRAIEMADLRARLAAADRADERKTR